MNKFYKLFFIVLLAFFGWQVSCNAQATKPLKTNSVLEFANRAALGTYVMPASGSHIAIIKNDAASVGETTMWTWVSGSGWEQFYFFMDGGYGITISGNTIITVDSSEIATQYDLTQLITHLTNGGLNVTSGANKVAKIDFANMVDGLNNASSHLLNEADKIIIQETNVGVLPRDVRQHYLLNGMRYEGIEVVGGSGYSQTLTKDDNMFIVRGAGNGSATVNLDSMRNNGDVNRVVWIVSNLTNDTATLVVNGRNTSHVNGTIGSYTKTTKLVLCVSVPSVGWVAYDATNITQLTAGYGLDIVNGVIIADTSQLATVYDVSQAPNFATADLTATAARSHNGGGFGLTFTNWLSYLITASSGGRDLTINGTDWQARSDFFKLRGAVGVSHAQPVLSLYEDPDNASANNFVGLKAPATMTADRTWELPSADVTSIGSLWKFNTSEVGSLITHQAGASGEPYTTFFPVQGIINGTDTKMESLTCFGVVPTAKRLVVGSISTTNGTIYDAVALVNVPASATSTGAGTRLKSYIVRLAIGDTIAIGGITHKFSDATLGSEDGVTQFHSQRAGVLTLQGTLSELGNWSVASLNLNKTVTAPATTGAQTINKPTGSVNFAAAATSLVVTNNLVTANSIIICQINTIDATMTTCTVEPTAGSFTITTPVAPTGETKVSFFLTN